jgi:hypothetical protein
LLQPRGCKYSSELRSRLPWNEGMPCTLEPCLAGKLQSEGKSIGQNNEIPIIEIGKEKELGSDENREIRLHSVVKYSLHISKNKSVAFQLAIHIITYLTQSCNLHCQIKIKRFMFKL